MQNPDRMHLKRQNIGAYESIEAWSCTCWSSTIHGSSERVTFVHTRTHMHVHVYDYSNRSNAHEVVISFNSVVVTFRQLLCGSVDTVLAMGMFARATRILVQKLCLQSP